MPYRIAVTCYAESPVAVHPSGPRAIAKALSDVNGLKLVFNTFWNAARRAAQKSGQVEET